MDNVTCYVYTQIDKQNKAQEGTIEGDWLTERYIGSLLRRLSFSNYKRVAAGYEYFLKVADVEDCARRLGISVHSEGSEHSEGTTEQTEEQTSGSEQEVATS